MVDAYYAAHPHEQALNIHTREVPGPDSGGIDTQDTTTEEGFTELWKQSPGELINAQLEQLHRVVKWSSTQPRFQAKASTSDFAWPLPLDQPLRLDGAKKAPEGSCEAGQDIPTGEQRAVAQPDMILFHGSTPVGLMQIIPGVDRDAAPNFALPRQGPVGTVSREAAASAVQATASGDKTRKDKRRKVESAGEHGDDGHGDEYGYHLHDWQQSPLVQLSTQLLFHDIPCGVLLGDWGRLMVFYELHRLEDHQRSRKRTRSQTAQAGTASRRDFALSIAPSGVYSFVPGHGTDATCLDPKVYASSLNAVPPPQRQHAGADIVSDPAAEDCLRFEARPGVIWAHTLGHPCMAHGQRRRQQAKAAGRGESSQEENRVEDLGPSAKRACPGWTTSLPTNTTSSAPPRKGQTTGPRLADVKAARAFAQKYWAFKKLPDNLVVGFKLRVRRTTPKKNKNPSSVFSCPKFERNKCEWKCKAATKDGFVELTCAEDEHSALCLESEREQPLSAIPSKKPGHRGQVIKGGGRARTRIHASLPRSPTDQDTDPLWKRCNTARITTLAAMPTPLAFGSYANVYRCLIPDGRPKEERPPVRFRDIARARTILKAQRQELEDTDDEEAPEPLLSRSHFRDKGGEARREREIAKIRRRTLDECMVYRQLQPLQGSFVPTLVGLVSPGMEPRSHADKLLLERIELSLDSLAGRQPRLFLDWQDAIREQVLAAIRACHALGVTHGDVHGSNIMLEWNPKVAARGQRPPRGGSCKKTRAASGARQDQQADVHAQVPPPSIERPVPAHLVIRKAGAGVAADDAASSGGLVPAADLDLRIALIDWDHARRDAPASVQADEVAGAEYLSKELQRKARRTAGLPFDPTI